MEDDAQDSLFSLTEAELAEMEAFIAQSGVNDRAAEVLRGCEPDIVAQVVSKGDLSHVRNPSAALLARIREATAGLGTKVKMKEEQAGGDAVDGDGPSIHEVELFLVSANIDERACEALRSASPEVQKAVLAQGDLAGARNPSALVYSRIQIAEKLINLGGKVDGAGKGTKGDNGGSFGRAGYGSRGGKGDVGSRGGKSEEGPTRGGGYGKGSPGAYATVGANLRAGYGGGGGCVGYGGCGRPVAGAGGGYGTPSVYMRGAFGGGKGGAANYGGGVGRSRADYGQSGGAGAGGGDGSFPWGPNAMPDILGITVPDSSSIVSEQGLPPDAPAIVFDKTMSIFSSSTHMLADVVGDFSSQVMFTHDPDWKVHPEIGRAILAAGGPEDCYTVAVCPSRQRWAVGVATGWKNGERAAKLALTVAIVAGTEDQPGLAEMHPEFGALCKAAGIAPPIVPPKDYTPARPVVGSSAKGGQRRRREDYGRRGPLDYEEELLAESDPFADADIAPQPETALPDQPTSVQVDPGAPPVHWVEVPLESALLSTGLPPEGPAISHSKSFDAFSSAHYILNTLLEEIGAEVRFEHDPDWELYPEVGQVIKKATGEENCFCIVICDVLCKWAVGVGGGKKTRELSGKLAISVALAQAMDCVEDMVSKFPEFGGVCANAGLMTTEPPAKRARGV